MAASLSTAGVVTILYALLLRRVNYERFKDLLVYCQIIFSFVFFLGYQLLPRLAGNIREAGIADLAHSWMAASPSLWFASLVEVAQGRIGCRLVWPRWRPWP